MTKEEFLAYAQINNNEVQVWYDETGPPYVLRGLTVPVKTQDIPSVDIADYLEQVQQITLPLNPDGSVIVDIIQRSLIEISPLIKYFFFEITPKHLPEVNSPALDSYIILSPSINSTDFNTSPYNILVGSIDTLRQSDYIMQSDRYKIGTLDRPYYTGPLNIDALLTGSAARANVQDSNYSNTGWTNSRYEGTKTSTVDYKTTPATTGRVFLGAEFSSGSTVPQINYLISSSQVVYKDFFYTGTGDTPQVNSKWANYEISRSSIYPDILYIKPSNYPFAYILPKVGDIVFIDSQAELMKVTLVDLDPDNQNWYALYVIRGYNNTVISSYDSGDEMKILTSVQIFNLKANQLSGVPKGRVHVKETGELIKLDSLGFIVL